MATFRRPMTTLATAALLTTSAFGLTSCGNPEEDVAQSVVDYYTFMTTGLTQSQINAMPEDALNDAQTNEKELCSTEAREKMRAYLKDINADAVINTAALNDDAACAYPAFVVSSKITLVDPENENRPTITVELDDDAITVADDKKHATVDASKVHLVVTPPAQNAAENTDGENNDAANAENNDTENTDAAAPTTIAAAELVPSATQTTAMTMNLGDNAQPGSSTVTFVKTDQGWRYDPTSDGDALVAFLQKYTQMVEENNAPEPDAPKAPAPEAPAPEAPAPAPDADAPMPLPETDPEFMH